MEKHRRKELSGKYFSLEILDCPKEIILFAANLGSENVTIENFTHFGRQRALFHFEIRLSAFSVVPSLTRFDLDFSVSKEDFLRCIELWDEQGCYALFHETSPLKFKATDLPEEQRYPALRHFGWTVEIAVPGSSSDGWAQITSPNKQIIDMVEARLNSLR